MYCSARHIRFRGSRWNAAVRIWLSACEQLNRVHRSITLSNYQVFVWFPYKFTFDIFCRLFSHLRCMRTPSGCALLIICFPENESVSHTVQFEIATEADCGDQPNRCIHRSHFRFLPLQHRYLPISRTTFALAISSWSVSLDFFSNSLTIFFRAHNAQLRR